MYIAKGKAQISNMLDMQWINPLDFAFLKKMSFLKMLSNDLIYNIYDI